MSDRVLAQQRQFFAAAIVVEDGHLVGLSAEAAASRRDVVRDNQMQPLGRQLRLRVCRQIAGLGCEPDANATPRQRRQDVGVLGELDGHQVGTI